MAETVFARSVTTKQTSPKDGRDCRADKSARNDVVSHRFNTLATRKSAFTLAEVLITLVIIGIIAAVTVPTLMANYRKQATISSLKKFNSTLANAVRLTEIDKGIPFAQWDDYNNSIEWWNENIGKHLPVVEIAENKYEINDLSSSGYTPAHLYMLNDGTTITNIYGNTKNGHFIDIWYDTNGAKGPNHWGRDIFTFTIKRGCGGVKGKTMVGAYTYSCGNQITRDRLKTFCKANGGKECTELIIRDGWEVKDDYPFSI